MPDLGSNPDRSLVRCCHLVGRYRSFGKYTESMNGDLVTLLTKQQIILRSQLTSLFRNQSNAGSEAPRGCDTVLRTQGYRKPQGATIDEFGAMEQ
jgi:hypothetical protein